MNACPPPNPQPVPAEEARAAVLIVEDERVARRALCTLLAAHGFNAIATESAEEAIQVLERLHAQALPRVALVDFNLPGMNGLDFITQLERMDPSAFPVLMSASSEECVGEAVRDRQLIYLRKPLDLTELLTVIAHPDERPSPGR
jgi:two-component system chemotaxis response regulator CheY